jgi:hypothetical protein
VHGDEQRKTNAATTTLGAGRREFREAMSLQVRSIDTWSRSHPGVMADGMTTIAKSKAVRWWKSEKRFAAPAPGQGQS